MKRPTLRDLLVDTRGDASMLLLRALNLEARGESANEQSMAMKFWSSRFCIAKTCTAPPLPLLIQRQAALSTSHKRISPSAAPLRACPAFQSTVNAVTCNSWPLNSLKHVLAKISQSARQQSPWELLSALIPSQSTETASQLHRPAANSQLEHSAFKSQSFIVNSPSEGLKQHNACMETQSTATAHTCAAQATSWYDLISDFDSKDQSRRVQSWEQLITRRDCQSTTVVITQQPCPVNVCMQTAFFRSQNISVPS